MSSTLSLSLQTNTFDALATVTVTATAGATATVASNFAYNESFYGGQSNVNVAIFLISVLVTVIIGFNRMTVVPLIASAAGSLDNALNWYSFLAKTQYTIHARTIAVAFADVFFGFQDAVLPLYSFFMLEKILVGIQRQIFMGIFGFLWLGVVAVRLTICGLHVKLFHISPQNAEDYASLNDEVNWITRAYFVVLACLECWSAFFLLRTFYRVRRESRHMGNTHGLFSQLATSSEIRVATLTAVGVTRAICFGFYDARRGFDRFAYTMEQCFPMLLIVDILTTRMAKLQGTLDSKQEDHAGEFEMPFDHGSEFSTAISSSTGTNIRLLLGSTGGSRRGTVDSIMGDFPAYAGKSMATATPGIPAVVEVSEDTIESGGSGNTKSQ